MKSDTHELYYLLSLLEIGSEHENHLHEAWSEWKDISAKQIRGDRNAWHEEGAILPRYSIDKTQKEGLTKELLLTLRSGN